MDETPLVNGQLISDQTCITDKNMIHELEQKGYGEIENKKLFLQEFETLYLLYTKKLILKKEKNILILIHSWVFVKKLVLKY